MDAKAHLSEYEKDRSMELVLIYIISKIWQNEWEQILQS